KSLEEISTKLKNLEEIKLSYFAGKKTMEGLDQNILIKEKADLHDEIRKTDDLIKTKEKSYQDLTLDINKEKSKRTSLKENIKKSESDLLSYEKEFEDKLGEKFKNKDDFRSYLKREGELEERKDRIDQYFKDLEREMTTRSNFLDFKDKKVLDLSEFKENIEELSREIKILDEEKITASTELDLIKKDGVKIKKIYQDFKGLSKTSQIVSYLSDLANGVTGAVKGIERLDFETFILSVYFDRVLNFANIR